MSAAILPPNSRWIHSTCVDHGLLNVSFVKFDDGALLIVAHGSTVNPDSSAPTLAHAAEIRRRKIFADVECAFWKEEPSLRDAMFLFDPGFIRKVYVVPNFISEGYFTQTVVPRVWLGLTLSRQQLHDDPGSRDCHAYACAGGEPAALANNIDHIIKSPPLMSRDAPVM